MRTSSFVPALLLLALAACSDATGPDRAPAVGKALVLVSFGEPGVSIIGDTGSSAAHLGLGDAFDGAVFTVRGDSLLTTSSKWGGDELLVTDLASGQTQVIPMPPGSNPAGAAFVSGLPGAEGVRYAVALRDSGAVALWLPENPQGVPVTMMARGMGTCPTDVFVAYSALWSVDANQNCRDQYQTLGPVRLIRATTFQARDTVTLADSVRGAARAFVVGDEVLVTAAGDYGDFQARVVAVDLATRQVRGSLRFPAGWFATSSRLGADGALYVTASPLTAYAPRVFRVDPATLSFSGTRAAGADYLDLRENGVLVRCDAATADADGELWCASNGAVASRILAFGAQAAITRVVPIPSGLAADIVVR